MRPFKHDGRRFQLLLAALLCTSIVPNHSLADDKETSNPPVKPEAANPAPAKVDAPAPVAAERESGVDLGTVPETEQAPASGGAPTNNQEPQPPTLPAPLHGLFPGPAYPRPPP